MFRTFVTATALAAAFVLPAFAQTAPPGGAMTAPSATPASDTPAMTCDQMMAKEESISGHASATRMTVAQNHMSMAKQAKAKGDEAGCKMQVTKAMDTLK